MSLKYFHLIFVTVASLALIGTGAWLYWGLAAELPGTLRLLGPFSALSGVALALYGGWFYKVKASKIIV
jgi:hypothetical protein